MSTKVELAREILNKNKGKARKDIIALFMKDADLSHNAASTYYYNLTKGSAKKEAATKKTTSAMKVIAAATKAVEKAAAAPAKARPSRSKAAVAARKAVADAGSAEGEFYTLPNGDEIDMSIVPAFLRK